MMRGHCFEYTGYDFKANERKAPLGDPKIPIFYGRDQVGVNGYVYGTVYAEAGMSFHYDPQDDTKYWGAPGAWNWTGTYAVQQYEDYPVMTQPWSVETPRLNDYAGYDITTGMYFFSA